MLLVEQAFVERDEIQAPLKMRAWKAKIDAQAYNQWCLCCVGELISSSLW